MKVNRSSVIHFNHLTKKKKSEIAELLQLYSKIVNWFIENYENQIPEKRKFDLILATEISKCPLKASARLIKNAYSEGYGMIQSAKSLSNTTKKPYVQPKHTGKKAILSETVNEVSFVTKTKEYDLNTTIKCIGDRKKISIPLKKNKHFNKWQNLGKLSKSVTLTKNSIQFSFEIETEKKKTTGENIGIDLGLKNLCTLSSGELIGDKIETLIIKLNNKVRNSKSWKKCKLQIKQYINEELKKIDFSSYRLIVVEKLKNIKYKMKLKRRLSKNIRARLSHWNSSYVLKRIQMLCEENRVSFRSVPSYYTSVDCSCCGHRDKKNRQSQEIFSCTKCGYSANADFNASLNILGRFLTGHYGAGFKA